jgi:hypothetical protein
VWMVPLAEEVAAIRVGLGHGGADRYKGPKGQGIAQHAGKVFLGGGEVSAPGMDLGGGNAMTGNEHR